MMILKAPLILSLSAVLALTACSENAARTPGATGGAVTGALLGAAIGASTPGKSRLAQAAVGGVLGAGLGGVIGTQLDRQAAELQGTVSGNTRVTNTGNEIVVTMPQDILFATGSAILRPDLQRDLSAIATNLTKYPDSTIVIAGHTDNTGTAALNQQLSQDRANAVANQLRAAGVPNARIVAFGRGEDFPIASNLTPEGRAQNRRVEITIRPTAQ